VWTLRDGRIESIGLGLANKYDLLSLSVFRSVDPVIALSASRWLVVCILSVGNCYPIYVANGTELMDDSRGRHELPTMNCRDLRLYDFPQHEHGFRFVWFDFAYLTGTISSLFASKPRFALGFSLFVMGRTIPSYRMIMKDEVKRLSAFRDHLRSDDKPIFDDLMLQCELYAPNAGSMASVVKEVPLKISMLFGQHKRLLALEEQLRTLKTK